MDKFWRVVKQEYRTRTFRKSFAIGTLLIPLMMALIIGVTVFVVTRTGDNRPLGYVDHSGFFAGTASTSTDDDESIQIIAYSTESDARDALENEELQAYLVVNSDYQETMFIDLYYLEDEPSTSAILDFDDFARQIILAGPPTELQTRIIEGTTLTIRSIDGNREFVNNGAGVIALIFPLIIAMFFLFAIMGASGYFLQVVTDEKENRTMEIMLTSVSPTQLIGGKSVALVAVGLTQITIWLGSIAAGWFIAKAFVEELQHIQLPWDVLLIFAAFFIPSYAIVAGMMITIGSIVTELQEGQQMSGIFNLLFTFPVFFSGLVFAAPNSPLMIVLSFWPTTSLITLVMRWGFTEIPGWQIALSWLISVGSAIIILWIATRVFRIGMLRYGQRITLKSLLSMVINTAEN